MIRGSVFSDREDRVPVSCQLVQGGDKVKGIEVLFDREGGM